MKFAQPRSVILVDDDDDFREALLDRLRLEDLDVKAFASAEAALRCIPQDYPGVVVSDLRMPGLDGRGLLKRVHALDSGLPVVLITGHGDISDAVEALKDGAYDFVAKPFDFERLNEILGRALEKRALVLDNRALAAAVSRASPDLPLMGRSSAIERLRTTIEQVADTKMDVLIEGETGVGKEVVARAIHDMGRRNIHPFVAVNCGALPPGLIESELFGHEAGAFPGAIKRRVGLIEQSHKGTLFLDEIEGMSTTAQVALLRVVEQREISPLGASGSRPLDLRILASSKIDLAQAVADGTFRADLYYRLNVLKLRVPPLRERREDIPLLFTHFLARTSANLQKNPPPLTAELRRRLIDHDWPGNVRELSHFAERVALDLQPLLPVEVESEDVGSLPERLDRFEKSVLHDALQHYGGDMVAVTRHLQIPRKTVYDRLARHGLKPSDFRKTGDARSGARVSSSER